VTRLGGRDEHLITHECDSVRRNASAIRMLFRKYLCGYHPGSFGLFLDLNTN
jgi:hypothetical protein